MPPVMTFPSGQNTFVKDHESSGKLVINFSRNPKKFALNRYIQIIPTKKTAGYYLEMTVEEAGRLLNTDGAEFNWPDGADAPAGTDGTESFRFLEFRTQRKAYAVRLGEMAVEQAGWAISDQHLAIKAQQAMTSRTQDVVTVLTNTANYAASHASAVSAISGNSGTWAASTTARQDIKRSLNYAALQILTDTLSAVDEESLRVILSPTDAANISQCQEIVDHIKGSPDALAQIRGELPGRNVRFGLPDKLYGFEIVVEDAVKTTSRKGATAAKQFVWPQGTAVMCSQVGGLVGVADAPNFSTACLFVYEKDEMAVETQHDVWNKRHDARIIDNRQAKVVAPSSGYVFGSIA
jgi:hypothetical protein